MGMENILDSWNPLDAVGSVDANVLAAAKKEKLRIF